MISSNHAPVFAIRRSFVLVLLAAAVLLLLWRVVYLHVLNKDFLQQQGDARHLRVVALSAHRGMITDRYGELYAQWVGADEAALPGMPDVLGWLGQIQVACEECGVSHWPVD